MTVNVSSIPPKSYDTFFHGGRISSEIGGAPGQPFVMYNIL